MVTLFVITTLSVVGLPMLNGFVGEFLVLSGSMQSGIHHHVGWTVLGTTGVILTASYMLWMIQRVFYGDLGLKPTTVAAPDLNAREHAALWPLVALFLLMGLGSPYWMRSHRHRRRPPAAPGTGAGSNQQRHEPSSVQPPHIRSATTRRRPR